MNITTFLTFVGAKLRQLQKADFIIIINDKVMVGQWQEYNRDKPYVLVDSQLRRYDLPLTVIKAKGWTYYKYSSYKLYMRRYDHVLWKRING